MSERDEVDCDRVLDGFDLALGWLSGRGVDHDIACDLADKWRSL